MRRARRPTLRPEAALTIIVAEVDIAVAGWVSVAEMVEADRVMVDEKHGSRAWPGTAPRQPFAEGCVVRLVD
ncbi:MAG: hypothetical protein BRC32_06085 [Actinobacteria bacterium QS_8_72_14]|nr:MAG: hypothetical protein BRC32_06085 [Actinobacteria bacterium QS_8_72_14]